MRNQLSRKVPVFYFAHIYYLCCLSVMPFDKIYIYIYIYIYILYIYIYIYTIYIVYIGPKILGEIIKKVFITCYVAFNFFESIHPCYQGG